MKSTIVRALYGAIILGAVLGASPARTQDYPSKPITIVVPFAAGSGTDQQARVIARAINLEYKVPVLVDDKPGASGFIAAQHVAKAAPDGYTVLMTTNTTHAANQHLFKKLPYDPVADFSPVALLTKGYMALVVPSASPIKSVADLIADARKRPGKINFGSGSSSSRVAGELFKQVAGIDVTNVPYKSNPLALTDLIGGQLDFMFADLPSGLPMVRAGKLRALAVSGARRLSALPQESTVAELGVKGYDMSYWTAVYLPAGAAPAVVKRLNQMLSNAMASAPVADFNASTNLENEFSSPAELAAFQASESQKWGRTIRAAGIEPE